MDGGFDALLIVDRGRIRFANAAVLALSGFSADELVGGSISRLLTAETTRGPDGGAAGARLLRKDGARVEIDLHVDYLPEGDRVLTFRPRREPGLEAHLRLVLDAMPDGILLLRDDRVIFANRAASRIAGVPVNELKSLASFTRSLDPVEANRVRDLLMGAAASSGRPRTALFRKRTDERMVSTFETGVASVDLDEGRTVLVVTRDVSERARLEAQLHQAESLASLGTLTAGLAHEINNPLGYVTLAIEAIQRKLASGYSSKAVLGPYVDQVAQGVDRVVTIVRDLKIFARFDEGPSEVVDVHKVLEAAVKLCSNELRQRARLVREYAATTRVIAGHPGRLGQVFLNLIINAMQAMPEERDPADNVITLSIRETTSGLEVVISDNGAGIAPDVLARVFDPFFTTKPVGVGTGLGLSVCEGIVTAMGGRIRADSTVGAGTTFTVSLPLLPPVARTARRRDISPPAQLAYRPRVLVVDDEPSLVETLERELSRDHQVVGVTSARRALELARSTPFDYILCDLNMPDLTGMDLHSLLASEENVLAERMVFMTGGPFTARVLSFLENTSSPHLEKPFGPREMRALLGNFRAMVS